ncbi:MAG: hypothetical protein IJ036_04185 [Lachnospiraceae bacterium]|nr:hypothetical protein [Lachnospiraceae bacterium]
MEGKDNKRLMWYGLAGAYLIYSTIDLLDGVNELSGTDRILAIGGGVVFGIAGVVILVSVIKAWRKNTAAANEALREMAAEEDELPEEEE